MREQQEQRYSQSVLGISGFNPADLAYADIAEAHNNIAGRAQKRHRGFWRGSASLCQEVSSPLQPNKFQQCLRLQRDQFNNVINFITFYRSYWAFKNHFPEQAEILLNNLDASYKRSLMSLSNSGSSNSLNVVANARSSSVSPRTARPAMSAAGKNFPLVLYLDKKTLH